MEGLAHARVVVTGGAGFIGSHVVRALIREKAHVWIVDNNFSQPSYTSFSNDFRRGTRVDLDIRHRSAVTRELLRIRPHFVYHLAAEAIVGDSFRNPYRTFQTNIMGTVHILEALRSAKDLRGVIVASSDKAYGKTNTAYTEESPLRGDHPYDVSKSSADLISHSYAVSYGLPVVVTRFGNVYGEGDFHFDRLIPGLCKAVIENNVFEIRSDGKFIRDYIYVNDVASGYLLLARNMHKTKGEAYNFSSSNTLSVLEVIRLFEKTLRREIPVKILNTQQNEIPYQHLTDTKVRALGWKQMHTLDQTIRPVFDWYKQAISLIS